MSLVPFEYDGSTVRTVIVDGEPWFVLADLARVLDISEVSRLASRLEDGVRQTHPISDSLGRTQQATIVSEAGMYEVVIRSDKPQAAGFRRWITAEVLPAIRKTGAYSITPALPQTYVEALRELATSVEAREAAEARADALEPSAAAWDLLASANGDYSVADAAKMLSRDPAIEIGRDRLFDRLSREKWLFRAKSKRGGWRAYQAHVDRGHLVERANAAFQNQRTGELEVPCPTVRVTPRGLQALHRLLGGSEPLAVRALEAVS